MYQHHNWQGALLDYPVSKVVCVGSNYAKKDGSRRYTFGCEEEKR